MRYGMLVQDLRYALRVLRKSPAFTAVAVVTLALGIGANTAIFSLIYAVLLRDIPVRNPQELVTLSQNGLFSGGESSDRISIPGYSPARGQEMRANWDEVGPNYFATIGIPILRGRDVTERDSVGPPSCWINQTMARYYFGDTNPIGHQIHDEYPETPYTCEIVGVVADAKYNSIRETTPRRFYAPFFNPIQPPASARFEIRFTGVGAPIASAVREAVRRADANLDPPDIRTISLEIDTELMQDRLTARLSTVFGVLAVLLACIGLYGVVSYNVALRTTEIGVRMALGAPRASVLALVLREALVVTGIGVAVGLAAAIAVTRVIQSLLFGLTPHDPVTLAGATLSLAAVAALAAGLPAWRASRVDPTVALRTE